MPSFKVNLEVLRDALFDRSLSQVGASLLEIKVTSPLKITGLTLTPTANFGVRVFNRADDKDADRVIGGKDAHIPFASQSAWLEYTLAAEVSGKIAFAPAALTASRELELSDYRIHAATDNAWGALNEDLESPRTFLELGDVKKLAPGEALLMKLGGALSASVTFSWSDVLANKLAEIVGDALPTEPVSVKLKSGLETTVGLKITDQFSVIVSRNHDGRFRFAVKKIASRNHTFGIEASLGVEVSAMPAIDQVVDPLFDAITAKLDPQKRIEKAASGELEKLRNDLRKRIAEAARWKASTGFAYEYARIEENEAIADFVLLDDAALADNYALVRAGDFATITDALRKDTGTRSILRYLNESSLTRRSSFGFTLGIGKWIDIAAKDESVFRQTTRTALDGFRLVVSRGTRKYVEKGIPQNDFEWVVDLKAEMETFARKPTTLDFDYGLHLLVTLERKALRRSDLQRMLDFAAMWDVRVPPADELAEAIGRKGTLRVQLLFERDALVAALAQQPALTSWADPLAMAMPYLSRFPQRRTFDGRRAAYRDAWRAWLTGAPIPQFDFPNVLTAVEKEGGPASFRWTAGQGHPQLRSRLDEFLRGTRALHAAMTTELAPEAIGDAYNALQAFWSQRLYVAAAGRWLLDRAPSTTRSMQIDLGTETITAS